jgi:hypothetical protein
MTSSPPEAVPAAMGPGREPLTDGYIGKSLETLTATVLAAKRHDQRQMMSLLTDTRDR